MKFQPILLIRGARFMSKVLENECVSCGLPCLGNACPNRAVPHYYCDCCNDEFEPNELYDYEGEMLCSECLLGKYETIADKE